MPTAGTQLGPRARHSAAARYRKPPDLEPGPEWNHLIAYHTYSHPGLVALTLAGGDVVGELTRTEELIREHVRGDATLFRALTATGGRSKARTPCPRPSWPTCSTEARG